MPPKQCGKCSKTVYPTEELKCLDKVWHKGCFKCQVCNMTLNMKNYKGYDKLPYCNTHYPQTKFTAVADTPEIRRIQKNTANQSNIQYHADFEKQKGKKIQIADDPEMQRVRQNMSVISNVTYHGEMEKRQAMEQRRPAEQVEGEAPMRNRMSDYNPSGEAPMRNRMSDYNPSANQVRASNPPPQQQQNPGPGRIADYDPAEQSYGGGGTPYSNRNSAGARQVYDSNTGRDRVQRFSSSGDDEQPSGPRHSGYDPRLSSGFGGMEQPPSRKVGSISDYDPLNENFGSVAGQQSSPPQRGPAPPQAQPAYQPPPPQMAPPPQPQPPRQQPNRGMVCLALYDYNAADTDEVSFSEGDQIIQCQPIDDGWMEGTVERTGQRGMLPSNYVERA